MEFPIRRGMLDSHFHGLIMRDRGLQPRRLLAELQTLGFRGGIDVSTTPADFEERSALYEHTPSILLSSGIHPGACGRIDTAAELARLRNQLEDSSVRPRIAALGEMGLDWYRGTEHRTEQLRVFEAQLELAAEHELPVIIHNREADEDVLRCLGSTPALTGVMHCFSSDWRVAERCLERGFLISFAGNVTYKRSDAVQDTARQVPPDRLLLETDSPFLAPRSVRGKTNHPGLVGHTYEHVAELRGVSVELLIEEVSSAFDSLFGAAPEPDAASER